MRRMNPQNMIGYSIDASRPLLPVCHIIIQVHIEVVIDGDGQFQNARLVDKDDNTIIPAAENSAGRAGSRPVGHPLCDKLQYLAGDFVSHGGKVTSGFAKNQAEPNNEFIESLANWCDSPYGHSKARSFGIHQQKS